MIVADMRVCPGCYARTVDFAWSHDLNGQLDPIYLGPVYFCSRCGWQNAYVPTSRRVRVAARQHIEHVARRRDRRASKRLGAPTHG